MSDKTKPEVPVEVEEGVTPPAELLLTEVAPAPIPPPAEKGPKHVRFDIDVPVGFALPEGEKVKNAFRIAVIAGVRWHPEWPRPRITVNAYRFYPMGDCLCWAGTALADCFGPLLPADVRLLAERHHGEPYVATGGSEKDAVARTMLKSLGIVAPAEKEKLTDFILPEQRR